MMRTEATQIESAVADATVCYLPESIEYLKSQGVRRLSWAKIVWVDRSASAEGCAGLFEVWVARPCEGDECAWRHNQLYQVRGSNGLGICRVKVADLRDCSDEMTPPEDLF